MSAVQQSGNFEIFSLPRYLAAINRFYDTIREGLEDANFTPRDFSLYGSSFDIEELEEEADILEKQDIFYSVYYPAEGITAFGLEEEYRDDARILGELVETKYDGNLDDFVRCFSETDREYLKEYTGLVELLE